MTDKTQSAQQTLQQRRAKHAWNNIEYIDRSVPEKTQKKYGSLVRGLPQLIQTDGLGQMLAFLLAKAGGNEQSEHGLAYAHIADWIKQEFKLTDNKLIEWLLRQSTADYRRTTAEVLAYINWLKRFAEAKGWKSEDNGG
ncbi:MAG: type III-B CRISPR module-associated protein Cmr5 [Chloroflexi bacterium CFX4]|nr:type III-B CRISPR module-associated protein Cmr5 [Chloroflexi bacterium CFX4]MDL1924116.1 type III-B CRISPR module-associated protein Cmr5 [Chloroflexi bacterium CFX3]